MSTKGVIFCDTKTWEVLNADIEEGSFFFWVGSQQVTFVKDDCLPDNTLFTLDERLKDILEEVKEEL